MLSGEWRISGVPAFEPADGRFAGYRGIALRDQGDGSQANAATELLTDPDSLRELVHEIKTPLNAIIGFAEIIEGQYLGPADQRYRQRAEEIVRQARLLLTAIDDLDFAAKVQSSPSTAVKQADLGALLERVTPDLRELAAGREIEIDVPRSVHGTRTTADADLAERLIFRLCSAVVGQAQAGDLLRLAVDPAGDLWRVSITRPKRLADLSEEQLAGGEADLERCFSLRLVRGLARIAGAELATDRETISLLFPRH
jgi:hypothetical protein